ncbi:hypothetical protein F5Y15DRAFT_301467 [Xylariaceae sp. FL0016]|nr:hypothetical protein F5Y15DRAFT_301467 [Xylariaceae sp. FL0016]
MKSALETASLFGPGPPRAATTRLSILLFVCAFFPRTSTAVADTLPYIPTSIFLPSSKSDYAVENATTDIAYVFAPQDDSVALLSLNISSTLKASSLSLKTLTSSLPFLDSDNTAFAPSLADNGSIIVYAGDCSSSSNSGIWTLSPSNKDGATSDWTQQTTSMDSGSDDGQMGPSFLGSSFSFSTILEPQVSSADTYVYGGMCPSSASNGSSSQSQATYSNQMMKITKADTIANSYSVSQVASKGPPVAEAGFTFTALTPSISNSSGYVTQQTTHVLLGGHTQYAFVNMSTAAIWSLPEESWGFISDIETASSGSTAESIDSRSGHTAVVNEDGSALIVLGGWVGDLTQAASPQLAILETGAGYGGDGDWQWTIPDTQPAGDGIYGHGAVLLPGNVMMIYGGYSISSSGNTKRQASGTTAKFFNLTSMSWSDDYTNPSYSASNPNGSSSGGNNDLKKKLGLGLGLGLGLAAIILAVLLYIHWRRRLKNRRTIRESAIRALAQDNNRFMGDDDDLVEGEQGRGWYMGGGDPYAQGSRSLGYQSLQASRGSMDAGRQNWFGDMPPPMQQIARKPVASRGARGQYQAMPAGPYDSAPLTSPTRGPGAMGPIYEADEEDTQHNVNAAGDIANEPISPVRNTNRDSGAFSDPFLTPTHERPISFPPASHAPGAQTPENKNRATDPDVQDWMSDVDAADALLSGRVAAPRPGTAGRSSPTRRNTVRSNRSYAADDENSRTESNISEANLSRSGSFRAGFGVAALASAVAALEGRGGSSSSSSAPSYNTARSSFPALQAEGPSLLHGRERNHDMDDYEPQEPGSPSKSKPRRSWFGSLRRVFSGPTPSPSPPGTGSSDRDPFRDSMAEASDFDARLGSLGGLGGIAAEGLLRRKGGRGAWDRTPSGQLQYSALPPGGSGFQQGESSGHAVSAFREKDVAPADDDDEWENDIEKAVEKRLVQVMFTVPKERLRVVNAEPDVESGEDVVVVDPERDLTSSEDEPVLVHKPPPPEPSLPVSQMERELDRGQEPVLETETGPETQILPKLQLHTGAERRDLSSLTIPALAPRPDSGPLLAPSPLLVPSPLSDDRPLTDDPEKETLRQELDAEWERAAQAFQPQERALDREIDKLGLQLQLENEKSRSLSQTPDLGRAPYDSGVGDLEGVMSSDGEGEEDKSMPGMALTTDDVFNSIPAPAPVASPRTSRARARTPHRHTPSRVSTPKNEGTSSLSSTKTGADWVRREMERQLEKDRDSEREKPRNRVMAMVENFESKSRDGSPAGSPTKGSAASSPVRGSPSPTRVRTPGR